MSNSHDTAVNSRYQIKVWIITEYNFEYLCNVEVHIIITYYVVNNYNILGHWTFKLWIQLVLYAIEFISLTRSKLLFLKLLAYIYLPANGIYFSTI